MLVVTSAGCLREWSQGELRLYFFLILWVWETHRKSTQVQDRR